jgi:hypothetical protein
MRINIVLSIFICYSIFSFGQKKEIPYRYKTFQVSFFPGLGTNGINPGQYKNGISLNIVSGYSAANGNFELGGLSNFNKYASSGIQIAGIANTIGGDVKAFKKYTRQELAELKANFTGFQVSGLSNLVTGDVIGSQISGGINLVGESATGLQIAGLANLNKSYFTGFQLSGLINFTNSFTSGVHISGLLNFPKGDLYGIQIAPFNKSDAIYGWQSQAGASHGLQIGVINFAHNMDGYQIGLINKAKEVRGLQVGLINIYKKNKEGIPIALVNYGNGSESLRLWTSELFLINAGLGTGSKKVRNTIFFSYNPFLDPNWPRRSFGYALSRISHLNNGKQFRSLELAFSWLNYDKEITKNSFNLLITPRFIYGVHLGRGIYYNVGAGLNYFASPIEDKERIGFFNSPIWPSLIIGFHTD